MEEWRRKVGRPTLYDPEYHPDQAMKYAMLGCTNERMAELFDVSEATIYNWLRDHPEFLEAVRAGKDDADSEIAASMYHVAKGYTHEAIRFDVIDKQVVETPYMKHYPPDGGVALNWLKNRHRDKWRDQKDVTFEDVTDDEAMMAARRKRVVEQYGETPPAE